MAIEQSKTSGSDMRSQTTKGPSTAGRGKAGGAQDAAAGSGFSAVLAATDADAGECMPNAVAAPDGASAVSAVAAQTQKPDAPSHSPADPAQMEKSSMQSGHKSTTDAAQKSSAAAAEVEDVDASEQPGLASAEQTAVAVVLQGVLPLRAESLSTTVQGDVAQESTLQSLTVTAGSLGGRGYMKTSQLQQNLSPIAGKGAGHPLAAVSLRADGSTEVTETVANASSFVAGLDMRQAMLGRIAGGQESSAEAGVKVMSLMAGMVQAEPVAGDRRGQDDVRGLGGAVQESWVAEPTDTLGQGAPSSGMEEKPVQETVRYWMGADSKQQAELTIHDVGGGSVDVTIHMHGKETQVSFRSDEQQARDALQAASGQLKDMLSEEGLTLSGLSVGTSSTGQGDKHDARHGAGSGKTVKLAGAGAEVSGVPINIGTSANATSVRGRSLDLFV